MIVSTTGARSTPSALPSEAAQGREAAITKRGVGEATLVPAIPSFDRDSARRAAAGLRDASRGTTLSGIKIKKLVDEGRARCGKSPRI